MDLLRHSGVDLVIGAIQSLVRAIASFPARFFKLGFAFASSRVFTTKCAVPSLEPFIMAEWRGVFPSPSGTFGSALYLTKHLISSDLGLETPIAKWRGVCILLFGKFGSAPFSSNVLQRIGVSNACCRHLYFTQFMSHSREEKGEETVTAIIYVLYRLDSGSIIDSHRGM
jgi:hypothetical protein